MASKEEDCFVHNTKEQQVLQRNIIKLHEANIEPLRLALDLVSQQVISLQAFQRILGLTSAFQSYEIINVLISAVTCSSGNFHKLIKILKDNPPLLSIVGTEMEKDYHESCQNTQQVTDISTDDNQRIINIDESFETDYNLMCASLAGLLFDFQKVAESKKISIDDLKQYIMLCHPDEECRKEIHEAADIAQLFVVIRSRFCSFFNYSILAKIAEKFKLPECFKLIQTYEVEKENYRRKFASSALAKELQKENENFNSSSYQCTIVLRLRWSLVRPLTVLEFKEIIRAVFHNLGDFIHLLKVEPSSIIVTMCAPNEVQQSLIAQAEEKIEFLRGIGVNNLTIGSTVIIDSIEDAKENVTQKDTSLEELGKKSTNSDSTPQILSAIEIYFNYISESKNAADYYIVVKAVILADSFRLPIPDQLFRGKDVSSLFSALKSILPHLNVTVKDYVIKFLIDKCEPFRLAIIEGKFVSESSQWLYNEGVLTPGVFELLSEHGVKTPTLSLLNTLVLDDRPEIISVLLENVSSSKLQKMVNFAAKEKKPIIASLFLHKMESITIDVIKNVSKCFDVEMLKEFLKTCDSERKGEILKFCFCGDKIEASKRKSFAITILESGHIDPRKLNLRDVLQYPKFLLFTDVSFLEKLIDAGVSLDSDLLHDAVKLIVDNFSDYKSERVELACALLERGADVKGLEVAYSGSGGTVIHAAIELALQTDCFRIFKLTCSKCDVTKCLYDKRKLTPLHVVMKQSECSQVAIEICHLLCHELKINPFLKDQDGRTAEEYCEDKNDKRLVIINEAKDTHPGATKKDAKNEKQSEASVETPVEKVSSKKGKGQMPNKRKVKELPKHKTKQSSSQHSSNPSSLAMMSPIAVTVIKGDKDIKDLLMHVLSQDLAYFASKRHINTMSNNDITASKDECEENVDTKEPEAMAEVKYDVFCSPHVKKFIETEQPKLVDRVLSTMRRLACGETNHRLVRKMHSKLPHTSIYHGDVDSAKRVIWHKTISYSPSKKEYCKILVMLDVVLDHDKLNKAVENAVNWIKRGGEEGGMCIVDLVTKGSPFYKPIHESEASETSKRVPVMMRDESGAVPIYSLPEYVLKAIKESSSRNARRLGLPLKLSQQEHKIVHMDADEKAIVNMSYQESTILVVGRSGTGKTTCCLSRMWEEFRHYCEFFYGNNESIIPHLQNLPIQGTTEITEVAKANSVIQPLEQKDGEGAIYKSPDSTKQDTFTEAVDDSTSAKQDQPVNARFDLHQVFVTKSPYLCQEVKRRFYDFVSSHNLMQKYKNLEHMPLPSSLNEIMFPLFITSRELLMLMDSTLKNNSYFKRKKNGELLDKITNSEQAHSKESAETLDDIDEWESDSEDESDNDSEVDDGISMKAASTGRRMIEVTASLFQDKIWPKMLSTEKNLEMKKFDPILVWQEIKSFIKGSIQALKSDNGYLSKEDYIKIGKSKAPNFTDKREAIYTMFQAYQKHRRDPTEVQEEYFDECDLLHHLYQHHSNFTCIIHNFYIDEVQDFTEAELYLLLSLSQCPNGNFLCGDSAQSIMKGVSFRFTDVRSLFHELDLCYRYHKVLVPDSLHYLTINYRAHAGILSVADSVIELLGYFFKDSFDAIPESIQNTTVRKVKPVQKPLLLHYDGLEEMFASNQFEGGCEIEFGAHQAVIVPSKDTVVPDSLKRSLVFTVLEAKGLEFNDVLLFNFFSESKVSSKSWELVSAYTCIEAEKSTETIATKYICTLDNYDESQHKALNAELKCLYTAITRAKRNLWICDVFDSAREEKQHPMYDFFLSKDLVKEFTGTSMSLIAEKSTAEEWKKAGDFFMSQQLWDQAKVSYYRAQNEGRIYHVCAFMEAVKHDFLKAAAYFLMADKVDHDRKVLIKAAKCFRAVAFKSKSEHMWYSRKIAEFFEKLGKVKRAGEFYLSAENFGEFIRLSESRRRYNRVIKLLLAHNQNVIALKKALEYGERVTIKGFQVRNLAHKCVRFYMSKEDKSFVKEVITNQLQSKVLELKYLEINGFHDDVLKMHAKSGQYNEVLEYAWKYRLHDQWLEIAQRLQNNEIFLLPIIYAQLAEGSSHDAKRLLQHVQHKRGTEVYHAQVLLLQAKLYSDKVACKEAIEIFKKLHNEGGVIEAVNILYDIDKNPSDVIDVLKYSLRAIRLLKVFKKSPQKLTQTESGWISSYLDLNQMLKLPNGSILVPTYEAYWLQIKSENGSISQQQLARKVEEHLISYCKKWFTKSNAIKNVSLLCKSELEEDLSAAGNGFTKYLNDFGRILELHETLNCFPDSQRIQSSILLAPLNTLNILQNCTWQREQLQYVQAHTCILNGLKAEYERVLEEQRELHFNSLDQCMQLWKLSLITTGNTKGLNQSLKGAKAPDEFRTDTGNHIFRSWVNFNFPKSSATAFVCNTNDGLLQKLAFSPRTFASISDENLLYVLTLQSISSIFLIAMQAKNKNFFVPQIFSFILGNFNILAWQHPSKGSVILECIMEREKPHLGHPAALNILTFLLDKKSQVVPRLLSHGNDTVTTYYFIVICTIYANLIIAEITLDDVHKKLIHFVEQLKLIDASGTKPSFSTTIYEELINASSVKDFFNIIDELLHTVQNQNMNQIWFDENENVIKSTSARPQTDILYPDIQMKLESEKQENSQDTQEDSIGPKGKLLNPLESHEIHPVTMEREGMFFKKLESHMIENSFCKICSFEIEPELKSDWQCTSTSYEKHIEGSSHLLKKVKYREIIDKRDNFEWKRRKALNDVKKLHTLRNLSPDDDTSLVQLDSRISQMHFKIESNTSRKELLEKEMKEIQEELKKISERTPLKSDTRHVSIKPDADDVLLDLLGKKKTSK